MYFFDGLSEGWYTFKRTLRFAFKNPLLLFPMLLAVVGIVGASYYAIVEYGVLEYPLYVVVFIYVVIVTVIVSICSLILLELLEQKEQGRRMNIFKAIFDALVYDLWRTLPVIVVWAVLKFFLTMLEIAIAAAKAKARENRRERGRTFRGYRERRLGRQQGFVDMIQTGVRLASMTILTSIAWEPLNPFKAMSKGISVYRNHFGSIVMGVGLSNLLKIVMFLPSFLVIIFVNNMYGEIPLGAMIVVMIYFGTVWAISLMVEQIYVAELYIWYMGYEKEKRVAIKEGFDVPESMTKVKRPSLFDDVADFQDEYEKLRPEKW